MITATFQDADVKTLREMGDDLKANNHDFAAVFANTGSGKGNFLAVCSKEAVEQGISAGALVGLVAGVTGGKGGGKPDSAMAGIGDLSKVEQALAQVVTFVKELKK